MMMTRVKPIPKKSPTKGDPGRKVWVARWYGRDVNPTTGKPIRRSRPIGEVGKGKMSRREAERHCQTIQAELDREATKPAKPAVDSSMTLERLIGIYPDRRRQDGGGRGLRRSVRPLAEATITSHLMTLRYLVQHFHGGRSIKNIGDNDIEQWLEALIAGRLSGARKQTGQTYTLSEQKVRGHVRNGKAIWNWMIKVGLAANNPFNDFASSPLATPANYYVPLDDFEAIIGRAEVSHGWRCMLGLCRLAGLRREAARTLPWDGVGNDSDGREHRIGIDWESHRIRVIGNHKTVRRFREVPIIPRLHELLRAAHSAAPFGQTITGLSPNNLVRNAQALIQAADLEPWPMMFQAMRSSAENDFKVGGHAPDTYAKWMGHSAAVSAKHYTSPMDSEFAAVTGLCAEAG